MILQWDGTKTENLKKDFTLEKVTYDPGDNDMS
jgi:hypothetical protein